jgi:hypothetical protein
MKIVPLTKIHSATEPLQNSFVATHEAIASQDLHHALYHLVRSINRESQPHWNCNHVIISCAGEEVLEQLVC